MRRLAAEGRMCPRTWPSWTPRESSTPELCSRIWRLSLSPPVLPAPPPAPTANAPRKPSRSSLLSGPRLRGRPRSPKRPSTTVLRSILRYVARRRSVQRPRPRRPEARRPRSGFLPLIGVASSSGQPPLLMTTVERVETRWVAGEAPCVRPDAQGRMASSVVPSASGAAVALAAYADFVDILILLVRNAVTERRKRGLLPTSPCEVVHGTRRAGFKRTPPSYSSP